MTTKTLLIIGFVWPEPESSAAGSRMMQLIAVFKSNNYQITFATACAKSDNAFNLKSIGVETQSITLNNSSFDSFIAQLNPDIVLFDRFMIEEQFGWRVAKQCPKALRLLDTEDLHCLRKGRQQALKDKVEFTKDYLYNDTAKREIASIYRCDLSLIISEVELEILKTDFKVEQELLCYLPFLLDAIPENHENSLPSFTTKEHFVTIGNFLHQPNVDGLVYLKESIWPLIKKQLPKAEMHIYGAYVSQKAKQLHNTKDGFLIKGFAKEVDKTMQSHKVCIVPLRFGAGLKGKIIDAMQNGTPCVSTSIGVEGIYGNLEPNGFIENDPEVFAQKAVTLYADEALWTEKQKQGLIIINTRFNKLLFIERFIKTITSLSETLDTHRKSNFIGSMLLHHTMQSTKFMSKWIEEKNK